MWTTSESITAISPALVAALGDMTDIRKGRKAKVPTKAGGSYEYTYADLADTIQSVRPILTAHGLAVIQTASTGVNDTVLISTTILHTSGEWITTDPLALPAGRTAQETGSAISYGRRYHLIATLGLAAEDDDGAGARGRTMRAPKQAAPQAPVSRTPSEAIIRDRITELGPRGAEVKTAFVAEFGKLTDLDTTRHDEALTWLEAYIAHTGAEK